MLRETRGKLSLASQVRGLRTRATPAVLRTSVQPSVVEQEVVEHTPEAEEELTKYAIQRVNDQIGENKHGRLFAVIYLQGKQHLVTAEDLVVVQGPFAPTIGDTFRLEKILAVGGRDFTLLGRPLLHKDLVNVEATVVEKSLSHCRIFFYNRRRKNSRKTKFERETHTLLRIHRVELLHKVNEAPDIEGVDGRIF
ncbi:39S ribosomal protein L21, mitochondrial-like isoform X2 [Homarus americanus]|uniref:Large ribosomal subunit protein bL21m n=2 Tax=Homarus americanus TaxID=6706 RepID=A0A8J5K0J2_HOMAM|nr:39S ribosomal protein L21, mitochondrial-like isoform X2 [Homarus americanus]KAG7167940.1 39S ribosomal protein L21-like [Homarus americanus]